MICALKSLIGVLPTWMREQTDRMGRGQLQELRLRLGQPPELVLSREIRHLDKSISGEDLSFVINAASRYSPWAAESVSKGYLTISGGHRIGICGDAVMDRGRLKGIRQVSSVCIRVARDWTGIAKGIPDTGSVLIIGKPGSGKTTLLRDLIRQRGTANSVAVVDERGELFPEGFHRGARTDVLTGCGKADGILMLLRTMGPRTIAVDEITAQEDTDALFQAFWCGVELLATAHAASTQDLRSRAGYRKLLEAGIFQTLVILQSDKSWRTERISL